MSLGDTIGTGFPSQTKSLIEYLVAAGVPVSALAGHFHDTYGQAVANVWAAKKVGLLHKALAGHGVLCLRIWHIDHQIPI